MDYVLKLIMLLNVPTEHVKITAGITTLLLFLLFIYIMCFIVKIISRWFIGSRFFKIKNPAWSNAMITTNFPGTLGYFVTGFVAHFCISLFFPLEYPILHDTAIKIVNLYFQIFILAFILKILTIMSIVSQSKRNSPVKGIFQFIKIFVGFFGVLIILAYFLGKEPTYFISAMGVLASVLMIVFKDTIVGFAAGWQLSMNDMIHLGDWIEMPKHNADGTVVDIALTTVYVRNWDNTIVTIPAYDLLSSSFQNWQGMIKAGARRIKRSINIDIQSIKFADDKLMAKLERFDLLKNYIKNKGQEIKEYNSSKNIQDNFFNGRYFTNIGLFRIYCQEYIKTRSYIRKDFTAIVKQKAPTTEGIPLEIYCFTNTTTLNEYEGYQADIFDHLLSVIGEFELNIFQNPTGRDFRKI